MKRMILCLTAIVVFSAFTLTLNVDVACAASLPSKPSKVVQRSASAGETTVKLKWKKVKGAKGYQIYRKKASSKKYKLVKTISKGKTLSYTDNNLKKNTKYNYKIRAYKTYKQYYNSSKKKWVVKRPLFSVNPKTRTAKRFGRFSAVKSVKTKLISLSAPKITARSGGYLRNDVSWAQVNGAQWYVATEYDAKGQATGSVTVRADQTLLASFFNRPKGVTYFYTVRACASVKGKTYRSPYSLKKASASKSTVIGQATQDENGKVRGGKAGDQKGGEVSTDSWTYNSTSGKYNNWKYVLRFKDRAAAERAARAMEMACANNTIGYDQSPSGGRAELYNRAQEVNWNLSAITKACETSCSPLVAVCVNCAGIFPDFNGSKAPGSTGMSDFINPLINTGAFIVYTDKNHTSKQIYLDRGDILVSPSKHTCMVL